MQQAVQYMKIQRLLIGNSQQTLLQQFRTDDDRQHVDRPILVQRRTLAGTQYTVAEAAEQVQVCFRAVSSGPGTHANRNIDVQQTSLIGICGR